MITVPPFNGFMVVIVKVNGDLGRMLRYRSGRTSFWGKILLLVLWLWVVLLMLPGLRELIARY